jgi:threonine synthase
MPVIEKTVTRFTSLQCAECDQKFNPDKVHSFASCERCKSNPLLSNYDLPVSAPEDLIIQNDRSMWRYRELLPSLNDNHRITLGEGWTPILPLPSLQTKLGLTNLFLKDESLNPTGSFKARGLSMAISKAKALGIAECIIPTAGNAGGAMAAYCSRAGIHATVVLPKHTPQAFKTECAYFGATVIQVEGLISHCAAKVAELNKEGKYYDVSTLKEPYRLEGKKTLGYEIAEQLNWQLPDVILYPTGGGTGLIGMWKAFREMIQMGWIENKLPRFIAVQSDRCQPVVEDFFHINRTAALPTIANGLAVPTPFAARLIQRVLFETSGDVVAVSEERILAGVRQLATLEGLFVSPEGGALVDAVKQLIHNGSLGADEKVLLLNTGSAYKYIDNF